MYFLRKYFIKYVQCTYNVIPTLADPRGYLEPRHQRSSDPPKRSAGKCFFDSYGIFIVNYGLWLWVSNGETARGHRRYQQGDFFLWIEIAKKNSCKFNPRPTGGGGLFRAPLPFSCDIFQTNADITTKLAVPTLSPNNFTHCVKILKARVS